MRGETNSLQNSHRYILPSERFSVRLLKAHRGQSGLQKQCCGFEEGFVRCVPVNLEETGASDEVGELSQIA